MSRVVSVLIAAVAAVFVAGCADPTGTGGGRTTTTTHVSGVEGFYHTVRRGESLSAIAYRNETTARELARINRISNMNKIRAGQKIFIPYKRTVSTSTPATKKIGSGSKGLVRATGGLSWPVSGRIIRDYGATSNGMPRHGMVIAVRPGTPVRAADSGRVVVSCDYMRGYGKTIVIDHGNGTTTAYCNNSELLVAEGDSVTKGQTIAKSGSSGRAAGGQLEFRVYRNGSPQDPRRYLTR
jgi:murein DD-endopeptidase MepM/ murein hydrolase activator NlpD